MILTGKTILVTGASSGIGKATAIECAKAGAQVIITGRNPERLHQTKEEILKATGRLPILCVGDLSEEEFIDKILEFMDQPLSGVALCAGTVSVDPVVYSTIEKFQKVFSTNFFANVELIRRLLKKKKLKRGSSVVVVTSVLGIDGYMAGNVTYGTSKAALEAWVKNCALEYAPKGIRFNSVHPGSINTPMLNLGSITEDQLAKQIAKIPIGRIGEPEEIGGPIVFLLSDASSFVTGSDLIIDGGQHLVF